MGHKSTLWRSICYELLHESLQNDFLESTEISYKIFNIL